MYWFTADEHYGHTKIIEYNNRPFSSIEEMDEALKTYFNLVVRKDDVTIHAGDFAWKNPKEYIAKLNGSHIFLRGSHDHWLPHSAKYIWRKHIDSQLVIVCHYAMRVWECSHYGSWQLYGHSHGKLVPEGKQYDVGVDNNMYYPVSFNMLVDIMKDYE